MSIEIKTVNTAKCGMDYFSFGSGKKTLVIIPGLSVRSVMLSAELIAKDYELFSKDYTVYVFDRRNALPPRYTVREAAEDTAAAMTALGLNNVCLFGTSQGGMISLLIAAGFKGLVSKLALGSACAKVTRTGFDCIGRWIDLAKSGNGRELYLDFGEKIYPREVFENYKKAFAMLGESLTDEELERFIILASGTGDFSAVDEIPAIECPVLALCAEDDAVLGREAGEELISVFSGKSGFSHYTYDGFSHAAFDTAPGYKQRLFDFFA